MAKRTPTEDVSSASSGLTNTLAPKGAPASLEVALLSTDPSSSLEQIRLILFGQQMREFDHKLKELEASFNHNALQLNQGLLERIAALEQRLVERIDQESQDRQIADNSLQGSLDTSSDDLEDKLTHQIKDIRADVREQNKEMNQKMDHLSQQLQAAIDELRLQKTDRVALASLLSNMAEQLRTD